jgi:hypothetical protein
MSTIFKGSTTFLLSTITLENVSIGTETGSFLVAFFLRQVWQDLKV